MMKKKRTSPGTPWDQDKYAAMLKRASEDLSGTLVMQMCVIGDRLGLFKDLHQRGPATSVGFAKRNNLIERYVREWLNALTAAQYLDYDPSTKRYSLPSEHAPVLAIEKHEKFMSGIFSMVPSLQRAVEHVVKAFSSGGGVTKDQFDEHYWSGMERCTIRWYEHYLTQAWLKRLPDIDDRLTNGGRAADLGCGRGQLLIKLAMAYPKSKFLGLDVHAPSIAQARSNARAAELGSRIIFKTKDAVEGLPQKPTFDLITTVDALHEFPRVPETLQAARDALKPSGVLLIHEVNVNEHVEDNISTRGAMFYSVSVLFCLSENLAQGGEGLGRLGLHESKVRALCAQAGFRQVERLWEDAVDVVFAVRP